MRRDCRDCLPQEPGQERSGMELDWRDYIHCDPAILVGKPVIKGTRISVEFVLDLYSAGWSEQLILENYPFLKLSELRAVLAYAADVVRAQTRIATSVPATA